MLVELLLSEGEQKPLTFNLASVHQQIVLSSAGCFVLSTAHFFRCRRGQVRSSGRFGSSPAGAGMTLAGATRKCRTLDRSSLCGSSVSCHLSKLTMRATTAALLCWSLHVSPCCFHLACVSVSVIQQTHIRVCNTAHSQVLGHCRCSLRVKFRGAGPEE